MQIRLHVHVCARVSGSGWGCRGSSRGSGVWAGCNAALVDFLVAASCPLFPLFAQQCNSLIPSFFRSATG